MTQPRPLARASPSVPCSRPDPHLPLPNPTRSRRFLGCRRSSGTRRRRGGAPRRPARPSLGFSLYFSYLPVAVLEKAFQGRTAAPRVPNGLELVRRKLVGFFQANSSASSIAERASKRRPRVLLALRPAPAAEREAIWASPCPRCCGTWTVLGKIALLPGRLVLLRTIFGADALWVAPARRACHRRRARREGEGGWRPARRRSRVRRIARLTKGRGAPRASVGGEPRSMLFCLASGDQAFQRSGAAPPRVRRGLFRMTPA